MLTKADTIEKARLVISFCENWEWGGKANFEDCAKFIHRYNFDDYTVHRAIWAYLIISDEKPKEYGILF